MSGPVGPLVAWSPIFWVVNERLGVGDGSGVAQLVTAEYSSAYP
jgi:hypothetical protein